MNLVLSNILYQQHGTDEGNQLQGGLALAGWLLCGYGYHEGCVDVRQILDKHKPSVVLVQAREDFDASSPGTFDKRVSFKNIDALASHPEIFKIQVVKDCPGRHDRREAWCNEIKADALLTYYHHDSVVPLSPWMEKYPLIRHRHTIDKHAVNDLPFSRNRKRCIVSGAMNREVYPLRTLAMNNAKSLGVEVLTHIGYGCIGNRNTDYLLKLCQYKVSIACSSRFGFSLRKLTEAAAAGCMVVTDLPKYDSLPWLDDALIRLPQGANLQHLQGAIDEAERTWTPEKAESFRALAMEHYDWQTNGTELSETIIKVASQCSNPTPS